MRRQRCTVTVCGQLSMNGGFCLSALFQSQGSERVPVELRILVGLKAKRGCFCALHNTPFTDAVVADPGDSYCPPSYYPSDPV